MRFKTNKEVLLGGIQTVQNIITTKTALPVLSNILIEAQGNKLKLTATDLDVGITCVIPIETQEPGSITIPAKRLSDIIKELPIGEVSVNTKKNNLVIIETENCQFKILGLAPEEFPKLPEFKDRQVINLEQSVLKEVFNLTSFAVSFDETRYILNGILFKIEKNNLLLVATDGKRLAMIDKTLKQDLEKSINIILMVGIITIIGAVIIFFLTREKGLDHLLAKLKKKND